MTQKINAAKMPPSAAPSPQTRLEPMQSAARGGKGVLRFLVMLGGQSLLILALLAAAQVWAPYEYKPSVIGGTAMGMLEAEAASELQDEQAEFERAVAQARVEGERVAELAFQEEIKALDYQYQAQLEVLQGQVQSSVAAYQNLYDRAAQLQQMAMTLESYVMQQRAETVRSTQVGTTFATNVFDVLCVFDPQSCSTANQLRGRLVDEVNMASQTGYGDVLAQTMNGIPDPATLRAQLGNPEL